jgi:dTMP kinase
MSGLFITFEGGEGSGKTTQIQRLKAWMEENYTELPLCLTREPGGTEDAEVIRGLLLNGVTQKWQPASEAMLMSASRHEHVVHVIQPALRKGDIVICDRFVDSTHVYQGFVGGVSGDVLDGLDKLSCNGLVPDLTLLLDVDSNVGLARTIKRGGSESRFEAKGEAFHQKVRQGFLARASKEPNRIVIIDAAGSPDNVARGVISAVKQLLAAHGSKMKTPNQ